MLSWAPHNEPFISKWSELVHWMLFLRFILYPLFASFFTCFLASMMLAFSYTYFPKDIYLNISMECFFHSVLDFFVVD